MNDLEIIKRRVFHIHERGHEVIENTPNTVLNDIIEAAEHMANRIAELEEANCENCKLVSALGCQKLFWRAESDSPCGCYTSTKKMKCNFWEAK